MRAGDRLNGSALPGALVGREREAALLQTSLRTARSGRSLITLVVGEPGIGKTRLVNEAAAIARTADMRVLRGNSDRAWREPMELWRGVHRALGIEPFRDLTLSAEVRRWDYLENLTGALSACAPALVVLEDVHWSDPTAIWVLQHLPRALDNAPIAFIATSRDHEVDMPPLEDLRRASRVITLNGLDVDAVHQLAVAETAGSSDSAIDAVDLHARTGGNPLFVQELVRSPGGSGVISEVLQGSFERFEEATLLGLATAAVAGPGAPLGVIATATGRSSGALGELLEPALSAGVLDQVSPVGVHFRHALFAETVAGLLDTHALDARLASAWEAVGGLDARASAAGHRVRAATTAAEIADAVPTTCEVAAELVAANRQARAAGLLAEAEQAAAACVDRPELRVRVALDLADVRTWLGDLDRALSSYQVAADLARSASDPVLRARAEIGANLYASAFVPDLPRMRRLEDALRTLPPDERHLRATLLGRLTIVGRADVDATDQVRAWADEAVAVARSTGDPVLVAQALLDHSMAPTSPAEIDASLVAADEVVSIAVRAGRPDLAMSGHQRRAGYYLNRGDLGAANLALSRAEVLAALLPSPGWRHTTLVQRTTLLALSGSREAAVASMEEAVRVGTGHVEAVVVTGCEAIHRVMLFDLYRHPDAAAEELHRVTSEMIADVPSPVFQVQRGFGAQLFGDSASMHDVLHRYGPEPELLLRSMTGDNLLRVFSDTVARAGATAYAARCYQALRPYAGLLNVGGGHSAGLPVDDVMGRLAALDGDITASIRHHRDAVALARSMPSPPLLVHCLDHLAEAVEQAGGSDGEPEALRAEAQALALAFGVLRSGQDVSPPDPPFTAWVQCDGPTWTFDTPFGHARLPDSNGLRQLARLLASPGVELTVLNLTGRTHASIAADLGAGLDARAKREYRRRLVELQAEIDNAEAGNDPIGSERAHVEMDALLRELKRAVGLGGRDRPTGSDVERARINVVRSLRRAIAAIAVQAPLLGAHLDDSVRTGGRCIYLPDPAAAMSWRVDTTEGRPA
ncbi:MAG TPA: AAA family ATPase [Lapillicoccus sp.]|nr:AAA family ATPase [Lapillicoccus sp.]